MKALENHRRALGTHALALLIGGCSALAVLDDAKLEENPGETPATCSTTDAANRIAVAWIGDSLVRIRDKRTEKVEEPRKSLTMAEQLRANRVEAEEERKEYVDQVDEIIAEATRYANEPDPAEAIRESMRAGRWQDNHSMAIFQAWLDKDPKAALAELSRNWSLQESEDIALLLERKFGKEWLAQQIGDEDAPFRFRNSALDVHARDLAWDGGLDDLLKTYYSISDPEMKLRLVSGFCLSWPMDDPSTTAQFLSKDMPAEMRNLLLDRWKPPIPIGFSNSSFPVNASMPHPYMSHEWYDQLCSSLDPNLIPDRFRMQTTGNYDDERETSSIPASLADSVDAKMKDGATREDAVRTSFPSMVGQAMDVGTDLGELYGEGEISRKELVEELSRRIPGSEVFSGELEREAWRCTLINSDPQRAAEWTTDLSKRGDMKPLLGAALNPSRDPRGKMRLEWRRNFTAGLDAGRMLPMGQSDQVSDWKRWFAISPMTAVQWRDSLPSGDPLRAELRKVEEQESERRTSP